MKIYLLDKKLVSEIRNHITLRTTQGVDTARSADEAGCHVSPILALLTDKLLRGQRMEEMLESVATEVKLIDKFYKKAQTDSTFLLDHKFSLVTPFCNGAEHKLRESIPFIWFLQRRLTALKPDESAAQVRDEILANAAQYKLEPGNPLVITALAALYGHEQAQQIIRKDAGKVSENNPLSEAQIDLINICLLPDLASTYSKRVWETSDKAPFDIFYTLLTTNPVLNAFAASLGVSAHPVTTQVEGKDVVECEYNMELTTDFFPAIANDGAQLAELVQKITAPAAPTPAQAAT